MERKEYQICTHCIMDTTDPLISFDSQGLCTYCHNFEDNIKKSWFPNEEGRERLKNIIKKIKTDGKQKEYDSIMGLSGGVDSSYMAYKVKEFGLRPLVVHVDGGWNSELAVKNIENIVKKLGYDLFTHVVDWEEMRDLQVAFLRSGVENQDVPQDHAFFAFLYNLATKKRIKYVLSGSNIATESTLPSSWGYNAMDLRQLNAIYKRFGKKKLKTFPKVSFFRYYFYYPFIKKMRVVRPLNYMPYNRLEAKELLKKELDWKDYGGKHHESRFTKFFQAYYLPKKFGYDKRRAHYSSMILSGQLTRNEALQLMEKELYSKNKLNEDREFIAKKLGLTCEQFSEIEKSRVKSFKDYPSNFNLFKLKNTIVRLLRKKSLLRKSL